MTGRRTNTSATLKVISSERRADAGELVSYATATVPATLIGAFAAAGTHSMVIETESNGVITVIRFGNTGAQQNLPRLTVACVASTPSAPRSSRSAFRNWTARAS